MVSSRTLIIVAALFTFNLLVAQPGQSLFDSPTKTNAPPMTTQLNAEQRADILMARKMYREAVEVYKEGPTESAIIWNKIGIAYHQMLNLDAARKNYEKAIKLNPQYSEAVNNLGTVYYSHKNSQKTISYSRRA